MQKSSLMTMPQIKLLLFLVNFFLSFTILLDEVRSCLTRYWKYLFNPHSRPTNNAIGWNHFEINYQPAARGTIKAFGKLGT